MFRETIYLGTNHTIKTYPNSKSLVAVKMKRASSPTLTLKTPNVETNLINWQNL